MLCLTVILTFGHFLANFERLVLGCIEAEVNTRVKALDEIYKIYTYASLGEKNKIYTLLHRSAFKKSAKFRQTFSHFCSLILFFIAIMVQISPILMTFSEFRQFVRKRYYNLLDS